MTKKVFRLNESEMLVLAKKLGEGLFENSLLILTGDLGAGKTTFTKGLALGLGVKVLVKSPTYTLVREYEGRLPLFHMDVYRTDGDIDGLDLADYFSRDGVCVIEWGELLDARDLPENHLSIKFDRLENQDLDERKLEITGEGRYSQLVAQL